MDPQTVNGLEQVIRRSMAAYTPPGGVADATRDPGSASSNSTESSAGATTGSSRVLPPPPVGPRTSSLCPPETPPRTTSLGVEEPLPVAPPPEYPIIEDEQVAARGDSDLSADLSAENDSSYLEISPHRQLPLAEHPRPVSIAPIAPPPDLDAVEEPVKEEAPTSRPRRQRLFQCLRAATLFGAVMVLTSAPTALRALAR